MIGRAEVVIKMSEDGEDSGWTVAREIALDSMIMPG
jgi:hypothetical protein